MTAFLLLLMSLLPRPTGADTTDTELLPYYPAPIDTVVVDSTHITYYDAGDSDSVILFVHGLGSNLSLWRDTLPAFTDDFRVLALDLPGFGLSDKAGVPATMPYFASIIAGFLDELGIGRVHFVGVSMGGQVGLTFALDHPDRLDRLVLVSPAGIETFTEQESQALKAVFTAANLQNTTDEIYRQNVALNFSSFDAAHHGWLIEQRQALAARSDFPAYAEANARAVAGMLDGPVFDRLGEVQAPTLVVFGQDDKLIPNRFLHPALTTAAVARTAVEILPQARLMLLEEAGHLLMIERPETFNATVRAFFE